MSDRSVSATLSRRRLIAWATGGAFTGATWSTGLAVIARGRRPRVTVVGDEGWQVLLFEHGSNRVLVLSGQFDESPEPAIDLVCGVLRQHIDLVASSNEAFALLSSGFRNRRSVTTMMRFDPHPGTSSSPASIGLFEPMSIRAGKLQIVLTPLWSEAWRLEPHVPDSWIGKAAVNGLVIGFGPSLDTIADHGDPRTALAIAPDGDIGRLWRALPGTSVATNAREPLARLRASRADQVPAALVRTFPRDIALFEFKDERLTLPDWQERAGDGST